MLNVPCDMWIIADLACCRTGVFDAGRVSFLYSDPQACQKKCEMLAFSDEETLAVHDNIYSNKEYSCYCRYRVKA